MVNQFGLNRQQSINCQEIRLINKLSVMQTPKESYWYRTEITKKGQLLTSKKLKLSHYTPWRHLDIEEV
jgi:hypothetical protein